MMIRFSTIALFAMLSLQLHASPSEVTFASATMNVTESRYEFANLETVELALFFEDSVPTSMILIIGDDATRLNVVDTKTTDGVVSYQANLLDNNPNGKRLSVFLQETTTDGKRSWSASIRKGFGWCGTMDSTMELTGTPDF
jgi:hypothetical protein